MQKTKRQIRWKRERGGWTNWRGKKIRKTRIKKKEMKVEWEKKKQEWRGRRSKRGIGECGK